MCDEQMAPAVTVYCLAYNHEKYIRKTLDGFVMQKTDFPFEVIVHDDASTDGTAQIIREYADRYPKLFHPILQKENQYSGQGHIFRRFIHPLIRGKYIAACEGDDYWTDPYKLQKQYDILETHPECVLCAHSVATCDEKGTMQQLQLPRPACRPSGSGVLDKNDFAQMLWIRAKCPFQLSSYFYRRVARDTETPWSDTLLDHELLWLCLTLGEVYYLAETMSVYRVGADGCWTDRTYKDHKAFTDYKLKYTKKALRFDAYTERRYHTVICTGLFPSVASLLLDGGSLTDAEITEIQRGYTEGVRMMPQYRKKKAELLYRMYRISPPLYRAAQNINRKRKRNADRTPYAHVSGEACGR